MWVVSAVCRQLFMMFSQITKALNEVWRQYEMSKKPAVILNLQLPAGTFDVNVTPDKREIFLTEVLYLKLVYPFGDVNFRPTGSLSGGQFKRSLAPIVGAFPFNIFSAATSEHLLRGRGQTADSSR
jgi:DNA mismatch repair protein PMS2